MLQCDEVEWFSGLISNINDRRWSLCRFQCTRLGWFFRCSGDWHTVHYRGGKSSWLHNNKQPLSFGTKRSSPCLIEINLDSTLIPVCNSIQCRYDTTRVFGIAVPWAQLSGSMLIPTSFWPFSSSAATGDPHPPTQYKPFEVALMQIFLSHIGYNLRHIL